MSVANARKTDPASSHIAGTIVERNIAPAQRAIVLDFLKQNPNKTSKELGAKHPYYDRYVFARRLPELRGKGLVKVSGLGKDKQQQWAAL